MKISKQFSPVTIVLETQEEIDQLYEITRYVSGGGKVRAFFDTLGKSLIDHSKFDIAKPKLAGDVTVR